VRRPLAWLCSVALVALGACPRREAVAIVERPSSVRTITAGEEPLARAVSSFGTITFERKVEIVSTIEGDVVEVAVEEGSATTPGAPLARLENLQLEVRRREAEASISSARAGLALAEAQLWEAGLAVEARIAEAERARIALAQKRLELEESRRTLANKEELAAAGGITAEAVQGLRLAHAALQSSCDALVKDLEIRLIGLRDGDIVAQGLAVPGEAESRIAALVEINTQSLRAGVDVARAHLASAQAELASVERLEEALEVRSPIAGVVGARLVERGEHVAQNTRLFTLIDASKLCAVFQLPEADAVRVREGMRAEINVDALGGGVIAGSVQRISPLIDPQSGSVSVRVSIPRAPAALKPGMFARVRLVLGEPLPAILVPSTCIAEKEGSRARLFAVVNGRAFARAVVLGAEVDGRFVVEQGLRPGETLIDSPSPVLREGEPVAPAE
jgi:membrane fusion protein (multidrug efflux system)